jgi:hypothetical protein
MLKFCIWSQKSTVEQNMAIYGNDPQSAMLPNTTQAAKERLQSSTLTKKQMIIFVFF